MDLGTENRLAALLLEEARMLRLQADKEGVQAYLQKPNVRHRPNSRFLAATVLGVQQANRVVEVNEMWRAREKELELESKMKSRTSDRMELRCKKRKNGSRDHFVSKIDQGRPYTTSSSMRDSHSSPDSEREDGLCDDEVEEFLRSRVRRGRGAIGSRMDEPGPYLAAPSGRQDDSMNPDVRLKEEWKCRVQGPEKPLFFKSKSSDEEPSREEKKKKNSNSERKQKRKSKHHHYQHKSQSRE